MSEAAHGKLARSLRERDLLLLFVGSVIGSGIFLTPGLILKQVGGSVGLALLIWILGGVLSLLGALTYAEMAAANPEAGGLYCYIRDGFGRLPAFLYGWSLFLVIASGTIAALAHAFTDYLNRIVHLEPWQNAGVVLAMIGVVTGVNVWGTRKSAAMQNDTTVVKAGLVVALGMLFLGLGLVGGHHLGELRESFGVKQTGAELYSGIGLAMILVLWAYEGWQFGTYSAGEVQNPQKSFPRAFLVGSLSLTALYVFAVIAYFVALGPKEAAASTTIAATAASVTMGGWAAKIVAFAILISTFSSANSVMLTSPRVFFAMASDGLFFKKLAEVHPAVRNAGRRSDSVGRVVGDSGFNWRVREVGGRGDLYWLGVLRVGGRSDLSHTASKRREATSLSSAWVSDHAAPICGGSGGDCGECDLCGGAQSERVPLPARGVGIDAAGTAGIFLLEKATAGRVSEMVRAGSEDPCRPAERFRGFRFSRRRPARQLTGA